VLKTSVGDIEIELWPKEAPKAVRNFVQLCLEGFYHDTIFHRIIKGFMVQGGDPTGTGTGTDTIYGGRPFSDEFHSRLKFSHRGLVACANQNAPHTNGSQFFITLDACNFLDRKNTIFGKVVGDTIYNVTRMGDLEVDDSDRPTDPPKITDVEVIWNPFDDIVPRTTAEERRAAREAKKPKKQKKGTKALNLLSFGDDAAGDEEELSAIGGGKIKSAHDAIQDPRFLRDDDAEALRVKQAEEEEHQRRKARNAVRDALSKPAAEEGAPKGETMEERLRARVEHERAAKVPRTGEEPEAAATAAGGPGEEDGGERGEGSGAAEDDGATRKREFRKQMRERREEIAGKRGAAPRRPAKEVENAELLTTWQLSRARYKQQKRLTGAREKDTLAKLQRFQSKLSSSVTGGQAEQETARSEAEDGEETAEAPSGVAYDGRVREDIDHSSYMPAAWRVDDYLTVEGDDAGGDLADLRAHKLVFSKIKTGPDEMQRSNNADDYVVHDPLLEKQKEKFSRTSQRNKKLQKEWAGRAIA